MFGTRFCITLNKSHHWLVALTLKTELFSSSLGFYKPGSSSFRGRLIIGRCHAWHHLIPALRALRWFCYPQKHLSWPSFHPAILEAPKRLGRILITHSIILLSFLTINRRLGDPRRTSWVWASWNKGGEVISLCLGY